MTRHGSEERAPLEAQPSADWLLSPGIGLLQVQLCGLHHAGKRLLCETWEEKTHLGRHSSSSAPTHFSFALDTSGACQKASCLGTLLPMTRAQLPSPPGALPHFNSSRFGREAQCAEPSLTCLILRQVLPLHCCSCKSRGASATAPGRTTTHSQAPLASTHPPQPFPSQRCPSRMLCGLEWGGKGRRVVLSRK